MALIKCPECKKEISEKAKSCPHCGYPLDNKKYCPRCGEAMKEEFCTNCGYPKTFQQPQPVIQPIQIQPKKKDPNAFSSGANAWLTIATIICFIVAILDLILGRHPRIYIAKMPIRIFWLNIIFVLDILLAISYINIRVLKNRISMIFFYITNALILVLNIHYLYLIYYYNGYVYNMYPFILAILYILGAIINTIITTLAVRKKIKKGYKLTAGPIVLLVVGFVMSIVINYLFELIFGFNHWFY